MKTVTIHEAKTHFSKLLARAHEGEEIIIAKAGQPWAKLVPLTSKQRIPVIAKGEVTSDFFDPLPEDELSQWES
jgi:prevent-host-death family protein